MAYDVKYLFICLFVICISTLVMCLLRSLACFLIGLCIFLYICMYVCVYLRERVFVWVGEGQRKRERENLKQAPCSAQIPTWGLIPWPWDHELNCNQESNAQLSHPVALWVCLFFFLFLERSRVQAGEGQRESEKERESQAGSTFNMEHDLGLDPTTLRSWPETKSGVRPSTDWATQVPRKMNF